MKKILILAIFTIVSLTLNSQDTIRLKHTNYTSVFSKSKHYPVLVEWWVTKVKVNCSKPLTSSDALWSVPYIARSKVICLSITLAPNAIADKVGDIEDS